MLSQSIDVFMPVIILAFLGAIVVLGGYLLSYVLSPKKHSELKDDPYECGEAPIGAAWSAFNVRFYVVGLIFIIFDVESALMFPVATVFKHYKDIGQFGVVLVDFLLFVSVLIAGIVYCWSKGDLDWVRSYQSPAKRKDGK